jgi:MFS family permease
VNLLTQATVFVVDYMHSQEHVSSGAASAILVGAGALAIPTLIAAGNLSDRIGRKTIGCGFLALSVVGALSFFLLARGIPMLLITLTATYAGQFGAWPTLSGFGTELFSTPVRALARSTVGLAQIIGQSGSFALAAGLITATGSLRIAVAILSLGPLAGAVIVAVHFPETASRELDDGPHLAAAVTGTSSASGSQPFGGTTVAVTPRKPYDRCPLRRTRSSCVSPN